MCISDLSIRQEMRKTEYCIRLLWQMRDPALMSWTRILVSEQGNQVRILDMFRP